MIDSGSINFSKNWNGKLEGIAFTTLRLYNPERYAVGNIHQILLKKIDGWVTDFGRARIVDARKIFGADLNIFICLLDTGYGVEDTKKILSRMYNGKDIDKQAFSYVLYKYER